MGPVPFGQQPSPQEVREALVLTVPDPVILYTHYYPAREEQVLDSLFLWHVAAASCC